MAEFGQLFKVQGRGKKDSLIAVTGGVPGHVARAFAEKCNSLGAARSEGVRLAVTAWVAKE